MKTIATTIVRHKTTGGLYALLGAGYGAWATARDDWFGQKDGGKDCVVFACDRHGTIGPFRMDEIEVLSVDGVSPKEAIADALERFGDQDSTDA